jgi:perosamine synthetase
MPSVPDREIPPTAGLPLQWGDFRPGSAALGEGVADLLDLPQPQLECSGTASLIVALSALRELAPGRRKVIVPGYTCPLVAMAVRRAGLEVRLCDLRAGHYDMDPERLAACADSNTLAIVPTHLGGRVADVANAVETAQRVGAFVIEDAAQALGARQGGRSVGLTGDIGFFSLAAGKGLSIYEGGLLVARDPAMRKRLRSTSAAIVPRRLGWELRRSIELLGYAALYRPGGLRMAYGNPLRRALDRDDPIAAVGDDFPPEIPFHRVGRWRNMVGTHALQRLPEFLAQTSRQAIERLSRLSAIVGVHVFADEAGDAGTWPFFMVLMPDTAARDAALDRLWRTGVGVSRLFIHALPDYAYLDPMHGEDVPNARDFAARTLTISNSLWLDDETFEGICGVLAGC